MRLFNDWMEPIVASLGGTPGRFSTLASRIADEKIVPPSSVAPAYWLKRIRGLGVGATAWAEEVLLIAASKASARCSACGA